MCGLTQYLKMEKIKSAKFSLKKRKNYVNTQKGLIYKKIRDKIEIAFT